jgi:hypothetical protein
LRHERRRRYEAEAAARRQQRKREAAEADQRLTAELSRVDEAARVRPLADQEKLTRRAYAQWAGGVALLAFMWDEVPWWLGLPAWLAVFAWLARPLRRMAGGRGDVCAFVLFVIAVPGMVFGLEPARGDIMLRLTGERAAVQVDYVDTHSSYNRSSGLTSWKEYTFRHTDTGRLVRPTKKGTLKPHRQVFEQDTTYIMLVDPRGRIEPETLGHASPLAELLWGGAFLLMGCAAVRHTSRKANPAFGKVARPLVPKSWKPRISRYFAAQARRRAHRRTAYTTPRGRRRWRLWAHVSALVAYGTGVALWWPLSPHQRGLLYVGLFVVLLVVMERAVRSWVNAFGVGGWLVTCMVAGGAMSHGYGVERGSPVGAAVCAGVFLVVGHLGVWLYIWTADTPGPARQRRPGAGRRP